MKKINVPSSIRKITDKIFQSEGTIRLGKDCPYSIMPIKKDSIVISGGVGGDISFEEELAERYNSKIFLFDPTESGKNIKIISEQIILIEQGLAGTTRTSVLDDEKEYSCVSITDFCRRNNISEIELVKLDIEGYEYEVLDDILNSNLKINQIVLEFHGWIRWDWWRIDRIYKKKLREAGYKLIYKNIDDYTYLKNE